MSRSIMSTDKECYLTHRTDNLHRHHIYFGTGQREQSEKWGCWCYLTGVVHNQSKNSVHFNRDLDLYLKRECQYEFEALYGHEKFMEVFGRNYI